MGYADVQSGPRVSQMLRFYRPSLGCPDAVDDGPKPRPVGEDGNAFAVLGKVTKALRRTGATPEKSNHEDMTSASGTVLVRSSWEVALQEGAGADVHRNGERQTTAHHGNSLVVDSGAGNAVASLPVDLGSQLEARPDHTSGRTPTASA